MAKITVSGQQYKLLATPPPIGELDALLVAATGCDTRETHDALARPCIAGRVSVALMPLLASPPDMLSLARAIALDPAAQPQVRQLYAAMLDAAHPEQQPETPDAE